MGSGVNPNIFWGGEGEFPIPCPPFPSLPVPPLALEVGPFKTS